MKFFWALPGEKEQPRDFSKCSDDELLNQFRTENWEKMPSAKDRVALLQEMENRFAARQGRTPAKVEELKTGSYYGAYNDMSGRLQVNVQDFSSYEVLDTYIHEANHAYQHHCVETGSGMREDVRLMMQAELARDDRGRLYNYASTSPEYDMQCDELDSNNRAGAFVLSQAQRYGDDPAFEAYVKERANHFREVNHDLTHRDGLRQAMQERQTDVAYIRGDLSEEQYQTLRENLADENRVDPTAETSKELGAAFAQAEAYYAAQAERDQAMQAPQAASSAQDAPAPDGEMKAAARMSGMDSAGETVHARVLTLGGRDVIHVNYQDRMDRLQGDYEQWAQSERAYAAELHSRSAAVLNDSSLSPNEQKTALLQIKREALIHAQEAREDYESFRSEAAGNASAGKAAISFSEKALLNSERVKPEELPLEQRNLYTEISKTIDELGFSSEAERCLNCGCVAVSPSDLGAALTALDAVVVTTEREIPIGEFFDTPAGGSTVLGSGEIVTSIRIPKSAALSQQIYFKHRTRKSIDFPIVSIAIDAEKEGETLKEIRIAFGAVSPVPRRAYEVEAFLKGKPLTKATALAASELAVRDCMALAENEYKINLLKVLLRRNLERL